MKLRDWLSLKVTDDARALRWFDSPKAEDRIARCYRELLAGYQIDPSTILKTTRMLADGERARCRAVDGHQRLAGKQPDHVDGRRAGALRGRRQQPCRQDTRERGGRTHPRLPSRGSSGTRAENR